MAAPKTFRFRERRNADGSTSFYARFTDQHGMRREFPLGRSPDWTAARAAKEMDYIKADVERGTWRAESARHEDSRVVLFRDMAYDWWHFKIVDRKAENTQLAYKAELEGHLVPFFGGMAVAEITKYDVDRYVRSRLDRKLAPAYINSQLQILGQILDLAMDWYDGILVANPARGKARRVQNRRAPSADRWLEPDHVELLLHAARDLDRTAKPGAYRRLGRESLIACLCFGGLRASEVCALTWADIDLERRIIRVGGTKTSAASRDINIVDGLYPLMKLHRGTTGFASASDYIWPTANGTRRDRNNLNQRIIRPVVARARELVAEDELQSKEDGSARRVDIVLARRITPHTFRRTFCAFAMWEARDPYYVQQQMGHRDAKFTQAVYNRVQSWTGELDPRVLRWMRRPTREAPASRLVLAHVGT